MTEYVDLRMEAYLVLDKTGKRRKVSEDINTAVSLAEQIKGNVYCVQFIEETRIPIERSHPDYKKALAYLKPDKEPA